MASSETDFQNFCYDAAKNFLQTVVVIDNEAEFYNRENESQKQVDPPIKVTMPEAKTLRVKQKGKSKVQSDKPKDSSDDESQPLPEISVDHQTKEQKSETNANKLNAKELIDRFADLEILCSVIRPEESDNIVERALKVATSADIFVVDWYLDKEDSSKAKQIIEKIISQDLNNRGRLRLFCIYTAEEAARVLTDIEKHIKTEIKIIKNIQKNTSEYSLTFGHSRIVVINKPSLSATNIVDCGELPEKLINLFAELNSGLLPSITLQAIAAIREETHHLLTVLNSKLDSSLVGHRCLLPVPDDVSEYCEGLISDELRGILAMNRIGDEYCSENSAKQWIASKGKLLYNKTTPFSRKQAYSLIENGGKNKGQEHKNFSTRLKYQWLAHKLKNDNSFVDKDGNKIQLKIARKQIFDPKTTAEADRLYKLPPINPKLFPQILEGDLKIGEAANNEFSQLCCYKRQAIGLRRPIEGWIPKLTLGTILQHIDTKKIYICLQPRCDSVRLDSEKIYKFPFLTIGEGKNSGCLVLSALNSDDKMEDKKLFFEPKPMHQEVFNFKCAVNNESIQATAQTDKFYFTATQFSHDTGQVNGNSKFLWLADLKDFFAQQIADEMSTRVGSVGMDHYEWLRRQGSN